MIGTVADCRLREQIYDSANSMVFRATPDDDGFSHVERPSVIVKILKEDYPTASELTRYRQEYEITRSLADVEGVIDVYGIEPYQRTYAILLEDIDGRSLKDLYLGKALPLRTFLSLAIQLAGVLGHVHQRSIIHKDINPTNILYNPARGSVKLIDFGIATQLSRENPTLKNPRVLEGTLAYISPEQTGRMNRVLDYRSDFYSLGVTFYELLTGKLPFPSSDPLALVHCHIAHQPVPPHEIAPQVPETLSRIVLKLMAKTAEERYQSAYGIQADLERCWQYLQEQDTIPDFPLGAQDFSNRFHIPQLLYGREGELVTLLQAFERVNQRGNASSELMLVAGYSGVGKSSLVAEVHKPITERRGYFIAGKYDQYQRDVPYSAAIDAFKDLVKQLLTESEEQLDRWRERLATALGPNGGVLAEVIPDIELILGAQPAAPELGPTEAQNRFNLVFQNFIRVCCNPEHPLVLFLDDLQWADSASLRLLERTMRDRQLKHCLVICAYRDNEVGPTHPFSALVNRLIDEQVAVNSITLHPLSQAHLCQLVSNTVGRTVEDVEPLASLVHQKTEGNPFFVNEFLKRLHDECLLHYRPETRRWEWDIEQIRAKDLTDNVVNLLIGRLQQLPAATQEALQLAACVGSQFDLSTLAIVCERSAEEVFRDLKFAIQMGLIVALSDLNSDLTIEHFRFEHDRIQQAAYATIAEERRMVVHLNIGRLLLKRMPAKTLSSRLFEVLDHLNHSIPLIVSPDNPHRDEPLRLAKLNLRGGKRAKSATAYHAAARYLNTGLQLMGQDGWTTNYTLTLALHDEAVQVANLNHNYSRLQELAAIVEQQAHSVLDCVNVSRVQILAKIAHNLHLDAIAIGLDILARLGVELPENSRPNISRELASVAQLRMDTAIHTLLDRPCMNAVDKLAAMQILSELLSSGYQASFGHFILSDLKQIELSIQYGNTAESAFAYDCYGIILCGVTGDIEAGYQFGQLAQAVVEKFGARNCKSRVVFVFNAFVRHWTEPLNNTIADLHLGFQAGLETGDLEYACYSLCWEAMHSLLTGRELRPLAARMQEFHETIAELQQSACLLYLRIYQQTVANLLGQADSPNQLNGEFLNEADVIVDSVQNKLAMAFFYVHKCMVSYLLQDYETAFDCVRQAHVNEDGMIAAVTVAQLNFYESLTNLALCDRRKLYANQHANAHQQPTSNNQEVTLPARESLLEQVDRNQLQMKQWASHAANNHQHKYDLVEAERHRVLGHVEQAGEYYDRAIAGAKANGYLNEEALANELAAKFYLSRDREKFGRVYLQEAYFNYYQWGATEKVRQLEGKYPRLVSISAALAGKSSKSDCQPLGVDTSGKGLHPSLGIDASSITMGATLQAPTTQINSAQVLDLEAVLQASQAIASEIVLEKLLVTLIQILVKNAGAQLGLLLLEKDGEFVIEASCDIETNTETVLQSLPCHGRLPQSLLNYVQRTQESVVLHDATQMGNFAADPYVQHHQSQSILCAPLLNQRQLSGILYLENNLTVGAFTPNRLKVLQLLSGQAAIAIDQASLYANLEQKVEERTQELSNTLAELRRTQEGLVQSEKMAALGQLVAGIAHEINTPMGAIRSSVQYIANFLDNTLLAQPQFFGGLTPEREQQFVQLLARALHPSEILSGRERRRARKRLAAELQAERIPEAEQLASLLLDTNLYANLEEFFSLFKSEDCIPFVKMVRHWTRVWESTRDIQTAGDRAAKIIFALKTYARHDYREDTAVAQVADGLEAVLTLYHNQIKHGVTVIRNYAEVPPIPCFFDELSQVWTNLIHNALQAMDYRGTLTVGITQVNSCIQVQITDSGSGIPDDLQSDIFKPFFTTKPPGEGSGLGLDIVKKIVDKHQGTISFQSVPGNTTFTVQLPISIVETDSSSEK